MNLSNLKQPLFLYDIYANDIPPKITISLTVKLYSLTDENRNENIDIKTTIVINILK